MSLLDTDLITERQLALGMSPIALARALGVSTVAIRSLERGTNHANLTLHRVKLLADTLGIPIAELFTREHETADIAPTSEDLKAEAALALIGKKIDPEDYATALGRTLADAHVAFKTLRQRRANTALHVQYRSGQWGFSPDPTLLTKSEAQALERACMKRTRITVNEAALLKEIIDARDGLAADDLTHAQRRILARFLRLGWVEKPSGRYLVTEAVVFSLGLSERTLPRRTPPTPTAKDARTSPKDGTQ